MKYIITLLCILSFSSLASSDEIMSCKVNNEQYVSYKLEERLFSEDRIFQKIGSKWVRECLCERVENKTIEWHTAIDKRCIKNV